MSVEFHPEKMLRVLRAHEVAFIVIGGFAGNILGSPLLTVDLDICYSRTVENLERLAAALRELHAELRDAPKGAQMALNAGALRNGMNFTFDTDSGSLDCLGEPTGVQGYETLLANAESVQTEGEELLVCALEDLIRMKRAAARPKDLAALIYLDALQEEVEARRRDKPS